MFDNATIRRALPGNPTAASKNTASPPRAAPGSPDTRINPMNDPAANAAARCHNSAPRTRRALFEADLVDCMVALSGQLFCTKQIPEMFQKAA